MRRLCCVPRRYIESRFVYDKADSASNLVLIQSQKNGKTGLRIEPPLILYNDNGLMTDEYKKLQTEVRL